MGDLGISCCEQLTGSGVWAGGRCNMRAVMWVRGKAWKGANLDINGVKKLADVSADPFGEAGGIPGPPAAVRNNR